MIELRIDTNLAAVVRDLDRMADELRAKILARVFQRTVQGVFTAASREIREELTLKAQDVKASTSVHAIRPRELEATIRVSGRAVPLSRYQARQVRTGVSVKVKRRGARKVVRGAFLARMPSGHTGVFRRRVVAGKRAHRLPLDELFSTSPANVLQDNAALVARLGHVAQERFGRELAREIEFRLRKKHPVKRRAA